MTISTKLSALFSWESQSSSVLNGPSCCRILVICQTMTTTYYSQTGPFDVFYHVEFEGRDSVLVYLNVNFPKFHWLSSGSQVGSFIQRWSTDQKKMACRVSELHVLFRLYWWTGSGPCVVLAEREILSILSKHRDHYWLWTGRRQRNLGQKHLFWQIAIGMKAGVTTLGKMFLYFLQPPMLVSMKVRSQQILQ